ncbi:MAG: M23 family metallopeptidase, partial [Bradyrhizobium sp.]|nr:M23 family metallopeptidase [Bradyrhizobium sp.]
MASPYDYPLAGNNPITETHAQGDPGVDWGVPVGTPVYAIASGTVIQIGAPGYGPNYVEIDHGGQIQSFYGHNSAALVHVGEKVAQGQEIALSGNEGNSTGPHLELGIRVNGQLVDPISFLQDQGGQMPTAPADPLSASQSATSSSSSPWTASQIATSMGLSEALFQSNPELAKVLQTAVAEQLDPSTAQGQANFTALLQSTNWYKSKTDAQRKWQLLSTSDPREADQQFGSALGNVIHTAAGMGVPLTTAQEWAIASQAVSLNLTSDEVKYAIAAKLKQTANGQYGGDAGKLA